MLIVPRCSESAGGRRGDAGGRSHHEEGRSDPEDHTTFLRDDPDHLLAALRPTLLHGLSNTSCRRRQSFPSGTARVSERGVRERRERGVREERRERGETG